MATTISLDMKKAVSIDDYFANTSKLAGALDAQTGRNENQTTDK